MKKPVKNAPKFSRFNQYLPDIQSQRVSQNALRWVGMEGVDVLISSDDGIFNAKANAGVSLDNPEARGIHMSRLYQLSQEISSLKKFTIQALQDLTREMLDSQQGLSVKAELELKFAMSISRPAIAGRGQGLRSYPLRIFSAVDASGRTFFEVQIKVLYSSTCPQSKALSEFVLMDRLKKNFESKAFNNVDQKVSLAEVLEFIKRQGLPATPHAQRSELTLRGRFDPHCSNELLVLGWIKQAIEELESEMATPVQTFVKKADEMAFAEKNAKHSKFCEDAARAVIGWFKRAEGSAAKLKQIKGKVVHFESLHPFNAVARFFAQS